MSEIKQNKQEQKRASQGLHQKNMPAPKKAAKKTKPKRRLYPEVSASWLLHVAPPWLWTGAPSHWWPCELSAAPHVALGPSWAIGGQSSSKKAWLEQQFALFSPISNKKPSLLLLLLLLFLLFDLFVLCPKKTIQVIQRLSRLASERLQLRTLRVQGFVEGSRLRGVPRRVYRLQRPSTNIYCNKVYRTILNHL